MNKQTLCIKKMSALLIIFMLGSTVIIGGTTTLEQDAWVSVIGGALMAIPMVIIYARISKLYPNKNIYEICIELFGKFFGRILVVLLTWYAFHLGALVLRNYAEFVNISSKPETPQLAIILSMIVVIVYLVKSGIKTMGRWSILVVLIIVFIIGMNFILSNADDNRFDNLLPFLNHSVKRILTDSYSLFTFPYAETIVFLSFFDSLDKKFSPYKAFLWSLAITVFLLLIVTIRNITLLGPFMLRISMFPSYAAIRLINVGKFLTKIEGIAMINYILLGITKVAVTLLATVKGITCFFNLKDYKTMTIPVALLMTVLAIIVYPNVLEMFEFLSLGYYPIYVIPFQIVIPLLIWIMAEVKKKKTTSKKPGLILVKNTKVYRLKPVS